MGEKQKIISISREFGSGGHEIARQIAEAMQLEFVDRSIIEMIAKEKLVDADKLHPYDEATRFVPRRTVRGHSSSPEETIAQMQFEYLKKKAAAGDSFVVVGRCAETVLKDFEGLTSIFVLGDQDKKLARVMDVYGLSEKEAKAKMTRHDRNRKAYHNRHSEGKWGDSRLYDLCINSSTLGMDKTVEVLEQYLQKRYE